MEGNVRNRREILMTERDLSVLSRKMPPDKWKYILRECLDISEADISRAEYSCRGEAVQAVIFKALHTWREGENPPVTRLDMYYKLNQAKTLSICTTNNWYQFLLPEGFQLDLVQQTSAQPTPQIKNRIKPRKGLFLWILSNPLQTNFLISALIMQIYFTCTTYYTEKRCGKGRNPYFHDFFMGLLIWFWTILGGSFLQFCTQLIGVHNMQLLIDLCRNHSRSVGLSCSILSMFIMASFGNIFYSYVGIMLCIMITNMAATERKNHIIRTSDVFQILHLSIVSSHSEK